MTKEMMSYWDVMPLEMQEYILVWKSVAEECDKMKAVMRELHKLWACPYTQYATLPWNSQCEPASSMVSICLRCSVFEHQIIHVKHRRDCECHQCFDQRFVERTTKPPRVYGPNQICKSLQPTKV